MNCLWISAIIGSDLFVDLSVISESHGKYRFDINFFFSNKTIPKKTIEGVLFLIFYAMHPTDISSTIQLAHKDMLIQIGICIKKFNFIVLNWNSLFHKLKVIITEDKKMPLIKLPSFCQWNKQQLLWHSSIKIYLKLISVYAICVCRDRKKNIILDLMSTFMDFIVKYVEFWSRFYFSFCWAWHLFCFDAHSHKTHTHIHTKEPNEELLY